MSQTDEGEDSKEERLVGAWLDRGPPGVHGRNLGRCFFVGFEACALLGGPQGRESRQSDEHGLILADHRLAWSDGALGRLGVVDLGGYRDEERRHLARQHFCATEEKRTRKRTVDLSMKHFSRLHGMQQAQVAVAGVQRRRRSCLPCQGETVKRARAKKLGSCSGN